MEYKLEEPVFLTFYKDNAKKKPIAQLQFYSTDRSGLYRANLLGFSQKYVLIAVSKRILDLIRDLMYLFSKTMSFNYGI